ncbi:MAG: hypothetical protein WC256_10305 [Desulfurivibrionaceae bacterium]|jgi:hypothetical protein
MRCPKCGYISFDRQKFCGKCSNDLMAVAEQLQGTVGKAASPFFLGAILGKKEIYTAEAGPALRDEEGALDLDELEAGAPPADEEGALDLDELEVDSRPADEDELDFAGAPLDEDYLEDQALPSFSLEDIDVSDLVPLQEEEEAPVLSLGEEQEEVLVAPVLPSNDEADLLSGIEFPGFDSDDTLKVDEKESPLDELEYEVAEPQANAEDEEIVDLSSLMNFDETPAQPENRGEDHDLFELTLGDQPEELHLSLEDEENVTDLAGVPKKPASAVADIADLGLILENDDQ